MKIKKINNLKRKVLGVYILMAVLTFILFILFVITSNKADSLFCLFMSISYVIIYFIAKYMYLTWLGKLQYILFLIPFFFSLLIIVMLNFYII